jgi:16S rRNA (guanine527-N7)-methyltransferase
LIQDIQKFTSELTRVFKLNGLSSLLNMEKSDKLFKLTERMLEENEKYNLTAIKEVDKIILNHYADCATLAARLPKDCSVIDVGCGAGFPSLPLAILRDDVKILAVDSTAKRVSYVDETAKLLALGNIECKVMRAEDGGRDPGLRERFDFATARAVAELRVLCELCLPFVKVGGELIAMKGKNGEFELKSAAKAISVLGGRSGKLEEVVINGGTEPLEHCFISVKKLGKTPSSYPRPYAQISKKPL